jgi:nitrogen fixation NifU-like protein
MNELTELYQEIILDHNKRPRNYRGIDDATHSAEGHNPLCGDEISVSLRLNGDQIEDISFQGEGCAVSKASASLMTTLIKGKSLQAAKEESSVIKQMLTSSEEPDDSMEELGDIIALSGVRRFPVRIKCATLAWHTFEAALKGKKETTTE